MSIDSYQSKWKNIKNAVFILWKGIKSSNFGKNPFLFNEINFIQNMVPIPSNNIHRNVHLKIPSNSNLVGSQRTNPEAITSRVKHDIASLHVNIHNPSGCSPTAMAMFF